MIIIMSHLNATKFHNESKPMNSEFCKKDALVFGFFLYVELCVLEDTERDSKSCECSSHTLPLNVLLEAPL